MSRLDELIQELCPNLPAGRQVGWCAYAILCDDGSIYKGHTNNIERRYKEHCCGQGAIHTKRHKPIRLIHIEKADSLEDSVKKEKWLKSGVGREFLQRVLENEQTR